jgi:hypothetical protein
MESKSNKSESRSRVEKYPLPSSVTSILSLIKDIMEEGSVQRIELDVSLPVRVVRTIAVGDPMMEEVDIGLKGILRQVEFIEYYSEGATPFQVVVDVMQLLHKEGRHPTCWVTGPSEQNPTLLDQWLEWKERGMPAGTDHLLGLPVQTVDDLQEDVLILCGSEYPSADTDEITLAIKTSIELGSEHERAEPIRKADDSVRTDSGEHPSTASQLALAAGSLRRVEWHPPDQHGEKVG